MLKFEKNRERELLTYAVNKKCPIYRKVENREDFIKLRIPYTLFTYHMIGLRIFSLVVFIKKDTSGEETRFPQQLEPLWWVYADSGSGSGSEHGLFLIVI